MSTTYTPEVRDAAAKIQRHAAITGTDPAFLLGDILIDDMALMARARTTGWRGQLARTRVFLNRPNIRAAWGTSLIFGAGFVMAALTSSGVIT